jgi:hypothetical protein
MGFLSEDAMRHADNVQPFSSDTATGGDEMDAKAFAESVLGVLSHLEVNDGV